MELSEFHTMMGFVAEVLNNGGVYITKGGKEWCLARDSASARDILKAYEVGYRAGARS